MTSRETLKHHAELVDKMAATRGIDLEESAICGRVSIDEISDAVLRCTSCPNPGHCEKFLSQSALARLTPEYCRNQELFEKLIP